MEYIKYFDLWSAIKKVVNKMTFKTIPLKTGDVFLIHLGVNIGSEMDGKGESFLSPVIVLKVTGIRSFIGIPTTTKEKSSESYVAISFNSTKNYAALSQIRSFDTLRIVRFYGSLQENDWKRLLSKFFYYFLENEIPSFEGISHCLSNEKLMDKL